MKIIILENNVKNDAVIKSGISQAVALLKTVGLNLEVTYKTTNLGLTPMALNTDVVQNGWGINYQPILDSVDGSQDIACMIFDWSKVPPFDYSSSKPMNPCTFNIKKGKTVPMQIPEQWYGYPDGYDYVLAEFFIHELCHALYYLTGTPNDQTHFKYSYPQFSQKSNNDYYLFLINSLVPAWNKVSNTVSIPSTTLSIVTITRSVSDSKQTLGKLRTNDGQFGCDTLERPWINNKQNISCIPKGTYNCQWKFKFNSLAYHYQVMNVPNRTGIFIHEGNYFFNVLGCILLGNQPQDINKDGEADVINSKLILKAFEAKMGKKPFTLIIQ